MTKIGFVLAQKTLLDANRMKFRWPRNSDELKLISKQQLEWLLCGLAIEPKNHFKEIDVNIENIAI